MGVGGVRKDEYECWDYGELIISNLIMSSQRPEEKKFMNYSLCFYQREKELRDISYRARLGFNQFNSSSKESALKARTVEHFVKFSEANKTQQKQLLEEDPEAYMEALIDVVVCLNRETDLMEYVLTTLDAIFTEERGALRFIVGEMKAGKYPNLISKLKGIETVNKKRDSYPLIVLGAYRVIAILLGELPREQFFNEQKVFLLELLQHKKAGKDLVSDYGLVSCFVHLNKHNFLAEIFMENGGASLISECFNRGGNDIQLIYYTLLNVWMLSFLEDNVEKFVGSPKTGVIKHICDVLQKVSREKITRVAFMIFKNIQEYPVCLELMIDNRLLKVIDTILKGNIKDEELMTDIKDIGAILESNIRVLSSFDKYVKEINNEMLEWSSVHNERFWKENAIKFEANEFHIIKKLKFLLSSKRALNVAIACYDIGEFCRFYPRGKAVIESHQIKEIIMEKARYAEDKSVREQALMALQKIMIQNWQAI